MTQLFASPGRYIRGYRELDKISDYVIYYGKSFVIINIEELDKVAKIAADPGQTSQVEPFEITEHEMKAVIITDDEIGKLYKNGGSLI